MSGQIPRGLPRLVRIQYMADTSHLAAGVSFTIDRTLFAGLIALKTYSSAVDAPYGLTGLPLARQSHIRCL